MKAGDLIGLVGLGLVALGLFIQFGVGLFHLGKHSQRIATLEEKTRGQGLLEASVAVLTSSMGEVKAQLGEISQDVKNLLTGKTVPGRRPKRPEG